MIYEAANAGIDQIIDRTRAGLAIFRKANGNDDTEFVRKLVQQFVDQAARAQHGAGAISMGLSAYRMAIQQEEIETLRDMVEMRDAALELMWAFSDNAEKGGRDG